jgi:tetratricopeptide (TPR) repeat protein
MDFRRLSSILIIILVAGLLVQPVSSAVTQTSDNIQKDAATSYYNNGDILLVKGDYENAIALFDQALASNTTLIKKSDALLYLYRDKGYAQIQLANYTAAVATLDAGLALYPKDAMLWNNKGYALFRLGKFEDALASYNSAVSFDSNYTIAHINRGDTLSRMGKYSEAVAAYTRANETDPGNKAAAEGLTAAKVAEASWAQTMTIVLVIVVIAAAGIVIWYVKFRKPAEPAVDEKKGKSKKKK